MSKTPSPSMPPPCSRRLPLDEITNVVAGLSSASYSSSALAPPTSSPAPPPPALVRPQAFDETPSPPTSSMPQTPRRSSRIASASVERASDGASSAGGPSRPGLILTPMRLDAQRRVKDAGADSLLLSASKRSVKKLRLSSGAPSPAAALSRAAEKRRMTVDDASDSSDDDYDGGRAMDVDDDLATPPRRLDFLNTADSDDRLKSFRLPLPPLGGRRAGRTTGVLGYLDARASGGGSRPGRRRMLGGGGLNSTLSTLDHRASSFVSSHTEDVYRLRSTYPDRDFTPLFSVAFSNGAKQVGGRQIAAVSSEEGVVDFLDVEKGASWDRENDRRRWQPHQNAIFDVCWSADDSQIITSSGDQAAIVTDVEKGSTVATLIGHRSSVKISICDPSSPSVITTASRDGNIHVYDLRANVSGSSVDAPRRKRSTVAMTGTSEHHAGIAGLLPVNVIQHAHAEKGGKKPNPHARTATRSPTSILYLPQRPHMLASAGTADGTIKLWDLRTHGSYTKTGPRAVVPPLAADESRDPSWGKSSSVFGQQAQGIGRAHGVASMVLGQDGDVIYALGTDNRIHTHSPLNLAQPLPFTYSAAALQTTFYSRLALSPCGSYLASGSGRGDVHLWEVGGSLGACPTEGAEREGIRLDFQSVSAAVQAGRKRMEVGSVSWSASGLASCSDDLSVRVWKPNPEAARYLRDDQTGAGWSWAGRAYD